MQFTLHDAWTLHISYNSMDACHYDWLPQNTEVYWIRSSVEEPFVWSLFHGKVVAAWDVCNRFWYHCALTDIVANKTWINTHIANKTFRFVAIDTNKADNIYLYSDCATNDKNFIDDWKHFYAQNYLWDLTADIVFRTKEQAIKALQAIYAINAQTFLQIMQQNKEQLIALTT